MTSLKATHRREVHVLRARRQLGDGMSKGCIVIKLGGGLITDKSQLKVVRPQIIAEVCDSIRIVSESGYDVILIHGAGSFGHLRAKAWRLHEGMKPNWVSKQDSMCKTQTDAVKVVRQDMDELNRHVVSVLTEIGLTTTIHPPREWAQGTGANFSGDLGRFQDFSSTDVHIAFGDVVNCPEGKVFGILSGDDLVFRLATEIPNVIRLVFAVGGVDGLLSSPPDSESGGNLLRTWRKSDGITGSHDSTVDVTGGIFLKAERGAQVAAKGIQVRIVKGVSERLTAACLGEKFIGTTILPE